MDQSKIDQPQLSKHVRPWLLQEAQQHQEMHVQNLQHTEENAFVDLAIAGGYQGGGGFPPMRSLVATAQQVELAEQKNYVDYYVADGSTPVELVEAWEQEPVAAGSEAVPMMAGMPASFHALSAQLSEVDALESNHSTNLQAASYASEMAAFKAAETSAKATAANREAETETGSDGVLPHWSYGMDLRKEQELE